MNIETKYDLGGTVWISELRVPGRILAVYVCENGVQYNVRWFDDRDTRTAYLFEDELSEPPKSEAVGFVKGAQ